MHFSVCFLKKKILYNSHPKRYNQGSSRRNWTEEETFALLAAYTARRKEFLEPRKKMIAFHNILVELQAKGTLVSLNCHKLDGMPININITQAKHTTSDMLKSRMSSLKRKYLQYVSTSTTPLHSNFPYYSIMQDLIKTMSGIASGQPFQDEKTSSDIGQSPIGDERNKERMWSESETFALLRAYSDHREEFITGSKNKDGFQNVLYDLNDSDVLVSK